MNETNYVPDIGRGEPFGFKISDSSHQDRTYVAVPGNVCDNPLCSCRELGLAIYDYPEEGQVLADYPVYNFILDLAARAPREDNDTDKKSLEFAHLFLEHCADDQWPLFEQAFVYLKDQAIDRKNILQGKAPGHPADSVPPVGRNERCPCGSGKKYKHCHGA